MFPPRLLVDAISGMLGIVARKDDKLPSERTSNKHFRWRIEVFPFVLVAASDRGPIYRRKSFSSRRGPFMPVMDVPFFGTRGLPSREDNRAERGRRVRGT